VRQVRIGQTLHRGVCGDVHGVFASAAIQTMTCGTGGAEQLLPFGCFVRTFRRGFRLRAQSNRRSRI